MTSWKQVAVSAVAFAGLSPLATARSHTTNVDYAHGAENADANWLDDILVQRRLAQDTETIYVHLITHTHDDIGWLKTIDEYFTGSRQDLAIAEVEQILDNVVEELIADENKRFTYVEMKFFSMWWERQTEELKEQVRTLVKEHRLEFMNAGMSMHDEACTHHDDMLANMQAGHEFLMREFGYKPTIGWHIDPFGHSNGNPRLFAEMGFDAWFFARIDYEDRNERLANKSMQWVWKPFNESLGDRVEIFTQVLQDMYWYPDGFDYDEREFYAEPVVSDESLETFNARRKGEKIASHALHRTQHYRGNNIFIPFGEDFAYGNARLNFHSADQLISYFNANLAEELNMKLLYSTPYHFIDALKAEGITWPTKYDDMFPYADDTDKYWTGFFSSRPNHKSQIRLNHRAFVSSQKLFADRALAADATEEELATQQSIKETMMDVIGSTQHHDSITGTERQHVANDYARMIDAAMTESNAEFARLVDTYVPIEGTKFHACGVSNSTYVDCDVPADDAFLVATYNPSTVYHQVQTFKVPPSEAYSVEAFDFVEETYSKVKADLLCHEYLENTKAQESTTDCELLV